MPFISPSHLSRIRRKPDMTVMLYRRDDVGIVPYKV